MGAGQHAANNGAFSPISHNPLGTMTDTSHNTPTQEFLELNTLLHNLPGMVYRSRKGDTRNFEFVSKGCFELTGYRSRRLLSDKSLFYNEIVHPDDRQRVHAMTHFKAGGPKKYDVNYRIITHGGKVKWVRDIGQRLDHPKNSTLFEGYISDISNLKLSEEVIRKQVQRFESLRKIDIAITSSFDLRVTLEVLLDQVASQLKVDGADVLVCNHTTQSLNFAAGWGLRSPARTGSQFRYIDHPASEAILECTNVHIADISHSNFPLSKIPYLEENNFITYHATPLVARGRVKGLLEVFFRKPFNPGEEWLRFMDALAGQAAIAIDNASLFNELHHANNELSMAFDLILERWGKALEIRGKEPEGHSQRLAEQTVHLAKQMGLNQDELVHIRRGAVLHDIGMMSIPDDILFKSGPLTPKEWQIMREHPNEAFRLLSPIGFLRPAIDIPYCHHERWDGAGYPRGLKGEQIPLAARIFAVVDVWDALISNRPFRAAWSRNEAISYLRGQKGKLFEPGVVETFVKFI
jgi:PAS domain S-box-containing protein